MRSFLLAALVALACLALAAPAMAQEPSISLTQTCDRDGNTEFRVDVSGMPVGEQVSYMIVDSRDQALVTVAQNNLTDASGSTFAIFGAALKRGIYAMYAYTGPYQTIGPGDEYPDAVKVETFDPSLATTYVSAEFEVTCGEATAPQCKVGGFEALGYRNQGQCVSTAARGG